MFIDLREKGIETEMERDKGRETSMWERNLDWLPTVYTDWRSNTGTHNLLVYRTTLQPIEPPEQD